MVVSEKIVVGGKEVEVILVKTSEPKGEFRIPCNLFFSSKVMAKALETTLMAIDKGRSLKKPGLEFLRRLLLEKQVSDAISFVNINDNKNCYVAIIAKDELTKGYREGQRAINNALGTESLPDKTAEAVNYYKQKLCFDKESIDEKVSEKLIIAYQTLSLEDKWPKCS